MVHSVSQIGLPVFPPLLASFISESICASFASVDIRSSFFLFVNDILYPFTPKISVKFIITFYLEKCNRGKEKKAVAARALTKGSLYIIMKISKQKLCYYKGVFMKRKFALLIAILMLSGCNGAESSDSFADTTAPESSETEQSTGEASETDGILEESAPANEYQPDDPDWLIPVLSDQKVTFELSGGVSRNKIKGEIGYDIDFDVTALDYYEACVQFAEDEFSGEELEAIRGRNYIAEVSPLFIPLCAEEADWLAVENYQMYGVKGCFLSRMLLIKDGEIVRELEPLELEQIYGNNVNNAVYRHGELYINTGSGLRKINMRTGEAQLVIPYDGLISHGLITAVSDDYIICGNGAQAVLVLKTGEFFYPEILWYSLGDEPLRLIGDRVEYTEDGIPKVYDIKTRTLTEDTPVFADGFSAKNNETWSACFEAVDDDSGSIKCFPRIKAINLSDGSEQVYDLKALNGGLTGDIIYNWGWLFLDGDRLWIDIRDYFTGVLNLSTGEAAEVERRYYDMSRVSEGLLEIVEEIGGDYVYSLAEIHYPV